MKTLKVSQSQPAMETLEARECFSATVYPAFTGGVTVAVGPVSGNSAAVNVVMCDGSVKFAHLGSNLPAVQ